MDTETFLDNLKIYTDRFAQTSQIPSEFYDFFGSNYETYVSATSKEREKIRGFVESSSKPKSFLGSLFHSKQETSQIAHLLLIYAKEKVLPQLKSTKDTAWLYRGLAAISMDDFTGTFDDQAYTGYPMKGDASFLLADLFVTAEEAGITPDSIFREMAEISSNKNKKYLPMKEFMNNAGKNKFAYERRQHGKFVGMF
jgi:hypothetical protein